MSKVRDAIETLESLVDGRPDEGIGEVLQPMVDLLAESEQAVQDYHFALDSREHGGVAQDKAFRRIQAAFDLRWQQGEETKRRQCDDNSQRPQAPGCCR